MDHEILLVIRIKHDISLRIDTQNMVKKLVPDPLIENHISGSTAGNVIMFVFVKIKVPTTCFYHKQEWKKYLELVFLSHFQYDFWIKIFLTLFSSNSPNFVAWLLLLCDIWQYAYWNYLLSSLWHPKWTLAFL